MGIFSKIKDVLFDTEEYTEQIKITPEMRDEDTPKKEEVVKPKEEKIEKVVPKEEVKKSEPVSERELFKTAESTFPFFDFDEKEFEESKPVTRTPVKPTPVEVPERRPILTPPTKPSAPTYTTTVKTTKTTDYGSYTKTVTTETTERKKFKPSPIISPVYGVLNKDYQKDDIIKKTDLLDNMDVQRVRDKAFGEKPKHEEVKEEEILEMPIPKTTYYEKTVTVSAPVDVPERTTKSIDELLDDTSEVPMDIDKVMDSIPDIDDVEMPPVPDVPDVPESLEQQEVIPEEEQDVNENTLENDLFDLIDSMYDSKEE